MKKKILSNLFILFITIVIVVAQEKIITGQVVDESGYPLPGVTVVVVEDLTKGTVTDSEGKFSLSVPENAKNIKFSFVGMDDLTLPVTFGKAYTVTMKSGTVQIDEVIAIGYGTQRKLSVTGAISSINENELKKLSANNAASMLQGKVSGVTIINDNVPGGEATVRVRGFSTINNNDPLFVVDGIPIVSGLNKVNPNDIESISVLKDASTTAIYGVRAANGVVIIQTKKGKAGELRVNVSARFGLHKDINKLDLLNTQEYGDLLWLESWNAHYLDRNVKYEPGNDIYGRGSKPTLYDYLIPAGKNFGEVDENNYSYEPGNEYLITRTNKQGTDWHDEIFNTALIQEYNLQVYGGTEKVQYMISGNYLDQEGIVMLTDFKRYSLRSNISAKLGEYFEIGENIGISMTRTRNQLENNSEASVVSQVYRMQPIIPVYDVGGNYAGTVVAGTGNGKNPVAVLNRNEKDLAKQFRLLGNVYLKANIINQLTAKTLLGIDLRSNQFRDRTLLNPEFSEPNSTNLLRQSSSDGWQWNWINTIDYKNTIAEEHNVSVMVGSEMVENYREWFQADRGNFFLTDPDYMVLGAGTAAQTNDGSFDKWRSFSIFSRVTYNYKYKYFFEGVIRTDASSRFAKGYRWGAFPGLSLGWRISEEPFFENLEKINNLKFRVGWGQNGNDQVGYYNSFDTYHANIDQTYYNLTGAATSSVFGFAHNQKGNKEGSWETTTTINTGIDVTMFDRKLEFSFDWYQRKTKDMLYPKEIPATFGTFQLPSINIGTMRNRGIDLTVTYHGKVNDDLNYSVAANLSHYKNKIIKLNNEGKELYGPSLRQRRYTRSENGKPFSYFYGYIVEGIFQSEEDVQNHVPYNTDSFTDDQYSAPGKFKYKDVNEDGKITPDDRTMIGNPHPDFTFGVTLGVNYKNFDLSLFFQGSYGNDLINYVKRWTDFNNFLGNRSPSRLYDSWKPPLDDYTKAHLDEHFHKYFTGNYSLPIALSQDSRMQENSTYFVEDGSYLRLKNLQLGYTFSKKVFEKFGVSTLRVYMQAINLFTLTDYSGLDPEVPFNKSNSRNIDPEVLETQGNNLINLGVDQGFFPASRQFFFGFDLSF